MTLYFPLYYLTTTFRKFRKLINLMCVFASINFGADSPGIVFTLCFSKQCFCFCTGNNAGSSEKHLYIGAYVWKSRLKSLEVGVLMVFSGYPREFVKGSFLLLILVICCIYFNKKKKKNCV